jgi:uncharacterized protein (TIGR02646 family)
MIRIDRSSVPMPAILRRGSGKADQEFAKAFAFYSDYGAVRQRGSFNFTLYRHRSVKEALVRLFNGKCAYCESKTLATGPADVELFRPKSGVIAADGTHLPLHYWWLANEWSNLYLACIDCNRASTRHSKNGLTRSGKGGRFPLEDESLRAEILAPIEALSRERPLLLDPCSDDVERILLFSEDGTVSSTDRRGLTTIEILGLNREPLVEARRHSAQLLLHLIHTLYRSRDSADASEIRASIHSQLKAMTAPDAAYASMCRQIVNASVSSAPGGVVERTLADDLLLPETPVFTRRAQREAKAALADFQAAQENYSLEATPEQSFNAYVSARDRTVERVSIQNMRALTKLDFAIADHGELAPWLMLLGENAVGKSTVLQSLALALVGDRYRDQLVSTLDIDLKGMVRSGAAFGEVKVYLSGATEARTLRIYPDGRLETSGRDAQLMVLAYGSTRLLPRRKGALSYGENYARIDNLFDPFIPLAHAEQWLLEASEEQFDYAAIAIKKMLAVQMDRDLVRQNGEVGLVERGMVVPLVRLCDGYQTSIALIVDIMSIVLPAWKTPAHAQALVLIDEVGNHLHPSWKLRFVEAIRSILPGVQVVATTHEPLCLRGLREGEVAVLRRGSRGGISLVTSLPAIDGLRIDQILTSEHFGLESTLDPLLHSKFTRYHFLLRKAEPSEAERREIDALRTAINEVQGLGTTERERRMLEAIDRFLASRSDMSDAKEIAAQEGQLDAELAAIWREAAVLAAVST